MDGELKKEPFWLHRAAQRIREGGVVVVPTETFYGLAADPFNDQAVDRIFSLKGRQSGKPLPLIASDRTTVCRSVRAESALVNELMDRFWPGSLTILVQPTRYFSENVTGPDGKIGVRVPPSCAARTLAGEAGGWITATSANLSGGEDPDEIAKIDSGVLEGVDLVVDLGRTPGGFPSTVVEATDCGISMIREGAVPAKVLEEFLKRRQRA